MFIPNGIIPAIVTPMRTNFEVDEDHLRHYVKWISNIPGVSALAVNTDAGETPFLSREERQRILVIVRNELGGRLPVIAGITGPSTSQAIQQALDARAEGAKALLVFSNPFYLGDPLPWEIPYDYHKSIAQGSGLPVILFQLLKGAGGMDFAEETLHRLTQLDSLVGIKEASFNPTRFLETLQQLRRAPRTISILSGNDTFLFESFLLGADGGLISFGSIAPRLVVEMFEKVKKNELKDGQEIWARLRPIADLIYAAPWRDYRARIKEILSLQNILKGSVVRPPLMPLSEKEKSLIEDALRKAEILRI